jgi:hypothetical protein
LVVEAFTERVLVHAGGRTRWCPWGLGSRAARPKRCAGPIGEHHGALVGVSGDAQFASVVEAMVMRAQADQVPGVGGPAVFPVDDVVDFEDVGLGAAGNSAALVAKYDEAAGSFGDGAAGAADRDRDAALDEGGGDQAVTGDVAADRFGQVRSVGVGAAAVGAEVNVDAVPVAASEVGDRVQRTFGDLAECVGPVDVG